MVGVLVSSSFGRWSLVIGIAVSLALHVMAGVLLRLGGVSPEPEPEPEPMVWLDIEEPPLPPEAEMPKEETAAQAPDTPETGDEPEAPAEEPDEPEATVIEKPPEPEPEELSGLADAGVDASPPVEPELAGLDAGPDAGPDAGTPLDGGPSGDAGAPLPDDVLAGLDDAGAGDAGSQVAVLGDGGSPEIAAAASRTPGTDANLLAYFPDGEMVAVMIRFDRLRQQPWSRLTQDILAPMPDHRSLVGSRDVSITRLLDTLVISSHEPRNVAATTLVGHTPLPGPEARAFVNHPEAPVFWRTARGGPIGHRMSSPLVMPGDRRVFLMPFPDWLVLSQPGHLGPLVRLATGDIDAARADPADLPDWLGRIQAIEKESGADSGPALIATISGKLLPAIAKIPYMGRIDVPERATVALELAPGGFYIRGTLLFRTEAHAGAFVTAAARTQRDFVSTQIGKLVLSRIHAYNALKGMTFKTSGRKVGYASSISIADAQAMMAFVATQTRTFFNSPATPAEPASERGSADAGPEAR